MSAFLERADAVFATKCAQRGRDNSSDSCLNMGATLDAYAAFHRRMFAPETPCAERRVLIVRESFSDVVGVGHAHMGLQRFLALGLALGRAVVFSHCASDEDPWLVTGRRLFKLAHPYDCAEPHLSMGEHYTGPNGIDLRWNPPRQALFRQCGFSETPLDTNSKALPQWHDGVRQSSRGHLERSRAPPPSPSPASLSPNSNRCYAMVASASEVVRTPIGRAVRPGGTTTRRAGSGW